MRATPVWITRSKGQGPSKLHTVTGFDAKEMHGEVSLRFKKPGKDHAGEEAEFFMGIRMSREEALELMRVLAQAVTDLEARMGTTLVP